MSEYESFGSTLTSAEKSKSDEMRKQQRIADRVRMFGATLTGEERKKLERGTNPE